MGTTAIRGQGVGLPNPLSQSAPLTSNVPAQSATIFPPRSNTVNLQAGQVWLLPAGQYWVTTGPYTFLQFLDPVSQNWRNWDTGVTKGVKVESDGGNWRLANLTGCPIGGNIPASGGGSGYTNGVYVAGIQYSQTGAINYSNGTAITGLSMNANVGSSTWVTVVGGACPTTASMVSVGSGYLYPPIVIVDSPPWGGIQATAYATISSGTISSIAFSNQGAGYNYGMPNLTIINDARDNVGTGGSAALLSTQVTGSGSLLAAYPFNPGNSISGTQATFISVTASTGSASCIPIMNFTVTGVTAASAGTLYGNAQPFEIRSLNNMTTAANALTNPLMGGNLLTLARPARIRSLSNAGGSAVSSSVIIEDAGLGIQVAQGGNVGAIIGEGNAGVFTLTYGGTTDYSTIQAI